MPILKLLASKDKTLLVGRDTLLVLDLYLDIINIVGRLDLKSNGFSSKSLNEVCMLGCKDHEVHILYDFCCSLSLAETEDEVHCHLLLL